MGRAKVVAPPPKDYVPEPLVAQPIEVVEEEVVVDSWTEGNLTEEVVEETPSTEDLEKQAIADKIYQELQEKKAEEEKKRKRLAKRESKIAAELALQIEELRKENEELARQKEAAEKAREEQILKARQQATEQRGSQLNIVKARKPSLVSRIKDFLKRRRIELATVPRANYEQAIIHQASVAVPKMLDDIEKMHERLTILEELLIKYKERQKIKD